MPPWKSLKELNEDYAHNDEFGRNYTSLDRAKSNLRHQGFSRDLSNLNDFIDKNPCFMDYCNRIQGALNRKNSALIIVSNPKALWDIHKYFPLLYALNNAGESVHRTDMKTLIESILDKDAVDISTKRYNNNLVLLSNFLTGDNRTAALLPSIEGVILPIMFSNKLVCTATTYFTRLSKVKEDILYRIRLFYSPDIEETFKRNAAFEFIDIKDDAPSEFD